VTTRRRQVRHLPGTRRGGRIGRAARLSPGTCAGSRPVRATAHVPPVASGGPAVRRKAAPSGPSSSTGRAAVLHTAGRRFDTVLGHCSTLGPSARRHRPECRTHPVGAGPGAAASRPRSSAEERFSPKEEAAGSNPAGGTHSHPLWTSPYRYRGVGVPGAKVADTSFHGQARVRVPSAASAVVAQRAERLRTAADPDLGHPSPSGPRFTASSHRMFSGVSSQNRCAPTSVTLNPSR
jgi:hypothetical protein